MKRNDFYNQGDEKAKLIVDNYINRVFVNQNNVDDLVNELESLLKDEGYAFWGGRGDYAYNLALEQLTNVFFN